MSTSGLPVPLTTVGCASALAVSAMATDITGVSRDLRSGKELTLILGPSLHSNIYWRAGNPGCRHLDAPGAFGRVWRHAEVHLISIYGAGIADCADYLRGFSIYDHLYRRIDSRRRI